MAPASWQSNWWASFFRTVLFPPWSMTIAKHYLRLITWKLCLPPIIYKWGTKKGLSVLIVSNQMAEVVVKTELSTTFPVSASSTPSFPGDRKPSNLLSGMAISTDWIGGLEKWELLIWLDLDTMLTLSRVWECDRAWQLEPLACGFPHSNKMICEIKKVFFILYRPVLSNVHWSQFPSDDRRAHENYVIN